MEASAKNDLPPDEEAALRESLRRCSPNTIDAAIRYRQDGDISLIPVIVEGIAARFLEPEVRPKLETGDDSLRIFEDLGIDSLTMVEIVILVEETLQISIDNEELKDLRTIGDVNKFIDSKVTGGPAPEKSLHVPIVELHNIMPQQAPFLFLQEADITPDEAKGIYQISGDEYFLEGHFKGNPVFPASIMIEALGQLGVLYLLKGTHEQLTSKVDASKIYFTSCDGIRVQRICKPGDQLRLSVRPKRIRHPLATFEGTITCNSEKVSHAEEITLTFDYLADTKA